MAIGKTNAGSGGSGGVNFKIIGGATQPTDPKENTIWITTETEISAWIFSAAEPEEPAEGMVWISTKTSSPGEFNALKKNALYVYPGTVRQSIAGAWTKAAAYLYQAGEWVRFSTAFVEGYQAVEYLESTGTQHLITGFQPNATSTYRHEFKYRQTAAQSEAYLMGIGSTTARYNLYSTGSGGSISWLIGTNTGTLIVTDVVTNDVDYTVDTTVSPTSVSMTIDGIEYGPATCKVVAPGSALALFGRRGSGTSADMCVKARIYYWRIYKDEELIHDFAPCYRESDSVAGMYDLVTDTFLTNAGSGTFVVGGDS